MTRPIARPVGASTTARQAASGAASGETSPPKDRAIPRAPFYITAERLYRIDRAMNEADWQLLNYLSECRLASGGQLIRRFWDTADRQSPAARAGRRALKRLSDWRVLDALPRRIGNRRSGSEGLVYGVGRAGVRLLDQREHWGRRLETPGALFVAHTLAITELAVSLWEANRDGEIELIEMQFEPACWRGFIAPGGRVVRLKPDMFLRVGAGNANEDRWMLEVDRGTEASGTIRAKIARHLAYYRTGQETIHPRVLWSVPDDRRAGQIVEIVRRLPSLDRQMFSVLLQNEVVEFLATEARS